MTLYKIFKENEERLETICYDNEGVSVQDCKEAQLAIIDGFIEMVEENKRPEPTNLEDDLVTTLEDDLVARDNFFFNLSLIDLKDKLLAERKLIEENK